MLNAEEQIKIIAKGVEEIINVDELRQKLSASIEEERPLIVKFGLDPSAPDIHLGHAVPLRKARQLQELGHKVVIIIGDFTGMIGDPTGKSKARKQLTHEQVLQNAKTYEEQIFRIMDPDKTEVRFNSEWLSKLNFEDVIMLSSKYTVSRMLEREDFKNRFTKELPISIHEFFYPLMQGYDSVAIKADIELGGTEQKFNVLMGRTLQKEYSQEKQIALFMPILEGIDGVEKMSKSLGNYIGINDSPNDMYGKVMSIPDNMIIKYYELATDIHPDDILTIKNRLELGINPRDIKMQLAKEIVRLYHGEEKSIEAEEYFKNVFQKKQMPDELVEYNIDKNDVTTGKVNIIKVVVDAKFADTNSEARRLLQQGAIKINGNKAEGIFVELNDGDVLQVGKRNIVRIKCQI